MNETGIFGVRVFFRSELNQATNNNLRNTLWIVPTQHLAIIRQIDIVPPGNFGHGPRYAGGGSGIGYPRLSELSFDTAYRPNNFPHNLTLLHEIGHIVENHFHCLTNSASEHREVLDAVPIPPAGRTHGPGEHYAIAYQQVIVGRSTPEVRAAVLASVAFNGVDTVRPGV
jgi:hypothetical protein